MHLVNWIRSGEASLSEAEILLSNNEAERTIRHAVIGGKNYYGSGSHTGAETAATLFTIIESCKKNDLDPRTYLLRVLNWLAESDEIETPLQHARRIRQYRSATELIKTTLAENPPSG